MSGSKLLDSSVWLEYLFNGKFAEFIDSSEIVYLSVLSWHEIKRKLHKEKIEPKKISRSLEFIRKRALFLSVIPEVADYAADISVKQGLAAMDALIYSTAKINSLPLFTCDNDFRGLEGVEMLNQN
ncbi:PIN domain-containing protein [Candidatus Woesearchaeota archaeon]|nr:PIN domain-containing protein [Candidatus Woesearchaeota archaeon]